MNREGTYNLYLLLSANALPRDDRGHLPFNLPTRFHIVVETNDQVVIDEEVTVLRAANSGEGQVNYGLKWMGFISGMPRIKCRVSDQSDGRVRSGGSLNLQLYRGH